MYILLDTVLKQEAVVINQCDLGLSKCRLINLLHVNVGCWGELSQMWKFQNEWYA